MIIYLNHIKHCLVGADSPEAYCARETKDKKTSQTAATSGHTSSFNSERTTPANY